MASLTTIQSLGDPVTSDNSLYYNSTTNSIYNYPLGTTGTINTNGTLIANGNYLYYDGSNANWVTSINPLQKLYYTTDFQLKDIDKRYLLSNNIKSIKKNKMYFNCNYEGNRIQPYEFIMKLIESKEKISVKINISDILTICYTNLQFTKIENNLNFNTNCDFSVLKVKFKYDNVLYENHKLSEKELRTDKLKKILKENE